MKSRFVTFTVLSFVSLTVLFSQDVLKPQSVVPVVDGAVLTGEYSYTKNIGGMTVSLALSPDKSILFASVQAGTSGWVALGLGSRVMDAARIFIGYDKEGIPSFSEENGMGHSHSAVKTGLAKEWKVKESSKTTTLELSVPSASFIQNGQVALILANGSQDDFSSRHASRGGLVVKVE